jgi:hypothetical protein
MRYLVSPSGVARKRGLPGLCNTSLCVEDIAEHWLTPTPALVARAQGGITLGRERGELGGDFCQLPGRLRFSSDCHSPAPTFLQPLCTRYISLARIVAFVPFAEYTLGLSSTFTLLALFADRFSALYCRPRFFGLRPLMRSARLRAPGLWNQFEIQSSSAKSLQDPIKLRRLSMF